MKHPIDEEAPKKNIPPEVEQASRLYRANRDQILAISETTGFRLIVEWVEKELAKSQKELLTASLETESDKKHLLTVRGEHTICSRFIEYLKNLQESKDREIEKK